MSSAGTAGQGLQDGWSRDCGPCVVGAGTAGLAWFEQGLRALRGLSRDCRAESAWQRLWDGR